MLPKMIVFFGVVVQVIGCFGCTINNIKYPEYCGVLFGRRLPPTIEWMSKYNLKEQLEISGCGLIYSHPRDAQPIGVMIRYVDVDVLMLNDILSYTTEDTVVYSAAYFISRKIKKGDDGFQDPELLSALRASIYRMNSPFSRAEVEEFTSFLWHGER